MYCIFEKEIYKAKKRNGQILLITYEKKEGFVNYIDVIGNKHNDIFMKQVKIEDVELIYTEVIIISYKGIDFELFEPITTISVEDNKFVLFTESEKIAKKYLFEKKEQFVFSKEIGKEQIDSIKILQKPIKEFAEHGVKERIIPHEEVDEWLRSIK